MTVDWRTTLDAIDVALGTASDVDVRLAAPVRARLVALGEVYDVRYPPAPAPDTPTTIVESSAHETWRTVTMPAVIGELDALAAQLDGDPPAAPTSNSLPVRARLETLLAAPITEARRELVRAALQVRFPAEPRFFVDGYYRSLSFEMLAGSATERLDGTHVSRASAYFVRAQRIRTNGALEEALAHALDAANDWLAIA